MEANAIVALVARISLMIEVVPRVLFVGAFPPPGTTIFGGMVTSCRALLQSTLPSRVNLELLDSTQLTNPPPVFAMRLALAARRFARFVRAFETRRPDVVLLFVAVGTSILEKGCMARYAQSRGVPVLMFPRGGSIVDACRKSHITRTWAKLAFRGATKIVCQGVAWQRFAIDTLGFQKSDVSVIRNWTATRELLDIGAQRGPWTGAPLRLIFVGWVEREKGIFELISACRDLRDGPPFTLDIVGDGHASAEASALVAQYGLISLVRFRGWLQTVDLMQALRGADVLVLPSWAEGLPNAVVEAMAAKLAVVASNVGAIPDVITDRRSGLLIVPKSHESLRRALQDVIGDRDLREKLASAAYQIAAREFGVESAVEKLIREIAGVIEAARALRTLGRFE